MTHQIFYLETVKVKKIKIELFMESTSSVNPFVKKIIIYNTRVSIFIYALMHKRIALERACVTVEYLYACPRSYFYK